jgi:hypothetical protein
VPLKEWLSLPWGKHVSVPRSVQGPRKVDPQSGERPGDGVEVQGNRRTGDLGSPVADRGAVACVIDSARVAVAKTVLDLVLTGEKIAWPDPLLPKSHPSTPIAPLRAEVCRAAPLPVVELMPMRILSPRPSPRSIAPCRSGRRRSDARPDTARVTS